MEETGEKRLWNSTSGLIMGPYLFRRQRTGRSLTGTGPMKERGNGYRKQRRFSYKNRRSFREKDKDDERDRHAGHTDTGHHLYAGKVLVKSFLKW